MTDEQNFIENLAVLLGGEETENFAIKSMSEGNVTLVVDLLRSDLELSEQFRLALSGLLDPAYDTPFKYPGVPNKRGRPSHPLWQEIRDVDVYSKVTKYIAENNCTLATAYEALDGEYQQGQESIEKAYQRVAKSIRARDNEA